jgi:3-methyladenine DNA glycosylase AlkD
MAYIPVGHQKYDILPMCRESGGEVFSYSPDLENEISELLPDEESVIPYGYDSYEGFDKQLDDYISQYGTEDGKLNRLGQLLTAYKADIKRRNIKGNWSVVKYVGESTGGIGGFTHGRYYYWPCSIEEPAYEGVIDDEEFTSYLASIGQSGKAYQSLEDAAADGVKEFAQEGSDWEIVEDPTGMAARHLGIEHSGELPPPEEYMSDVRYMMHKAHGMGFKPLTDYDRAKEVKHGCVIIEGDYGGQVYLTCPMKYVKCSHKALLQLASDLDSIYWDDEEGCRVYYENYKPPHGIFGGMGGGVLVDGLWVHPEFEDIGIKDRVGEVMNGNRPRVDIDIFDIFRYNKNDEKAAPMSAYMRDQFPFLGIPSPRRKDISRRFFKAVKKTDLDWDFVFKCWEQPEREFQYLAKDYLAKQKTNLAATDVPRLRDLVIQKSWWDTVDGLDVIIGDIALRFPEVNATLLEWSADENFWLRRIAIDHQLGRKTKTNVDLLEQIIANNFGQTEFFINKAIGWSLRDYSKTNPDWVRLFIDRNNEKMTSLSIKEASKYI